MTQDFLVFLDAEKGYSPKTLEAYASDLSQFWRFARSENVLQLGDITTQVVRAWIVEMKQRGLAPSSIARHVYALRSFWSFLLDNESVSHDPLRRISVPKRKQAVPTCLTVDEVKLLLDAAKAHRNSTVAARDYAMISTLVFTGMRRGELLGLHLGDVNAATGTVHIRHGKGDKARLVPAPNEVLDPVGEWLELRPPSSNDYLFTTVYGNRIHPSRMQIIWKRVLRDSGVTRDGVSMHTLRHTFATLLLKNGADLFAIQRLLGHSRLDTTSIYLHANDGDLRDGVSKHPLVSDSRGQPASSEAGTRAPAWSTTRHWRIIRGGWRAERAVRVHDALGQQGLHIGLGGAPRSAAAMQ